MFSAPLIEWEGRVDIKIISTLMQVNIALGYISDTFHPIINKSLPVTLVTSTSILSILMV